MRGGDLTTNFVRLDRHGHRKGSVFADRGRNRDARKYVTKYVGKFETFVKRLNDTRIEDRSVKF